ncbi:MAG: hypothetical protein EBQ70_08975 [Betaproteobacteria bacterium]|nr:hypothetical protein [Betaproteobacteria bacterium]
MRYIKFLVLAVFVLTGCAKERDLRVLCKGTLTKIEFKNNEEIILDKNDEFLNQYQFTIDKIQKNNYPYKFPCAKETDTEITCVIDFTLGDGSVETIKFNKLKNTVSDIVLRKKTAPGFPSKESFEGFCEVVSAKIP